MSNVTAIPATSEKPGLINEAAYIIVLLLAVLIVVLTITFCCYIFRAHFLSLPTSFDISRQRASPITVVVSSDAQCAAGLDERALASYPKLLYSQVKQRNPGGEPAAGSSCCSICLGDYKDDDMLLFLPNCAHFFHLNCVEPWLRVRSTCPVCRNSPIRDSPLIPAVRLPFTGGA